MVHLIQSSTDFEHLKGIHMPKLPKLELTTDAEYVANLINATMWL